MKQRFRSSLSGQLLLFSMGLFLSLALAFVITRVYVINSVRKNVLDTNEKIQFQIAGKMEDYCNRLSHIAEALAYSPTTKNYFKQDERERVMSFDDMEIVFTNTMLLDEDIVGVSLYDENLVQIAEIGRGKELDVEKEGLKEKIEFISLGENDSIERSNFAVYYPVYDLESRQYGKQIGMVVLVLKLDELASFLQDSGATKNTEMYLSDNNGKILAAFGNETLEMAWQSDDDYLIQSRSVVPEGWEVTSRIPKKDLIGGMGISMGMIMIAYAVASSLIGTLIYFVYRNFIRRIYKIDQFIQNVTYEPDKRMKVKWADEIGSVVSSLNEMLDERKRMDQELQDSQKRIYEIELAEKQLQILAYRNQINPHFLYNTFDCIRGMALYYDNEDIAEITKALSEVFRFAVKGGNIVTVKDEIDYIKEYATIIEYRFMGKIEINIDAQEELLSQRVIKLILQPVVENAVFHGLEQKMGDGEVMVTIRKKWDHYIMFLVEDNGCGMEEEKVKQILNSLEKKMDEKGIGIANIYKRLRLFYGDDMVFEIKSKLGKGTRVMIVVPDNVEDK